MSSEACTLQQDVASSKESLCPVCSDVSRLLSTYHTKVKNDGPVALVWTLRIRELVTAAETGCEFCWFITQTFFTGDCSTVAGKIGLAKQQDELRVAEKRKTEIKSASDGALRILEKVENDSFKFSLVPDQEKIALPNMEKVMIKMYACAFDERTRRALCGPRTEMFVEVYAREGDPAAKHITTRPLNSNPSSPESFEKARSWLHKCTEEHPTCPKPKVTYLPTIIVDVSAADRDFLRLHDQGGKEHYAVLSYLSGGPQPFATTSETLTIRLKGFSKSGLPQTLQDAVTVTQKMGLRYLWVDSLCRLQDSQKDQHTEALETIDLYKNAYFTIFAAHAENCNDGFLGNRGTRPSFGLPYVCPDGSFGTISISQEETYNHIWEPIHRDPWMLQAQLFSPRVLIYGSRFLWQCQYAQHSDGGIEDWDRGAAWSEKHRLPSEIFIQGEESDLAARSDIVRLRKSWYATVKEYTRRKLSEPDDMLPAIAGIVSQLQKLNQDDYLAGLWRSNLAHELMWTSGRGAKSIPAPKWRAPSWSWASVDNGISFGTIPEGSEVIAKILECSTTLASKDAPFGQVINGQLQMTAPVKQVEWPIVEKVWEEGASLQLSNDERTRNMELMAWIMGQMNTQDRITGVTEGQQSRSEAWLLQMFRRAGYVEKGVFVEKPSWSGLVLEETESGSYRRIGVFFNRYEEWMGEWEPHTVTIE